jgi:hypothetical protein
MVTTRSHFIRSLTPSDVPRHTRANQLQRRGRTANRVGMADDWLHSSFRTPPARALHWREVMNALPTKQPESGKAGYALAWLLGVPLPLLLVIYLVAHGC